MPDCLCDPGEVGFFNGAVWEACSIHSEDVRTPVVASVRQVEAAGVESGDNTKAGRQRANAPAPATGNGVLMHADGTAFRIPIAHRDTVPWDLAQAYALAFGVLAVASGATPEQIREAERRIETLGHNPSIPAEVRAIAIDTLARAGDRANVRGHCDA